MYVSLGLKKPGDFTVSEGHGYPLVWIIIRAKDKYPPYREVLGFRQSWFHNWGIHVIDYIWGSFIRNYIA